MVGPSGAGKSTLGRLLAGIHPPRDRLGHRRWRRPGRAAARRPARPRRAGHPGAPRLRRHAAREPRAGRAPGRRRRRDPVRAGRGRRPRLGATPCPTASTPLVGSGGRALTAAQAQQIALARLVLADPHTLVLDEATSLIDPRAARHLERSLAAVLHGRTVIAIAHRLFSAHDADRVAVVEDGVISEFGSHDELVAPAARTPPCGTPGTAGTERDEGDYPCRERRGSALPAGGRPSRCRSGADPCRVHRPGAGRRGRRAHHRVPAMGPVLGLDPVHEPPLRRPGPAWPEGRHDAGRGLGEVAARSPVTPGCSPRPCPPKRRSTSTDASATSTPCALLLPDEATELILRKPLG